MQKEFCPKLPENAIHLIRNYFLSLQESLSDTFSQLDPSLMIHDDPWTSSLGTGLTRILKGEVFEKAGVNFSEVSANHLPPAASAARPELANSPFQALGISLVIHPDNPYVPTAHANLRFFISQPASGPQLWWFGGGFDLTPYYGFIEDCQHWHKMAQEACVPFGESIYPEFKAACDQYFYLKHRQEARGIGGLFFDDYHRESFDHSFALIQSIGQGFIKAYAPIIARRKNTPYGSREKNFQLYRRGRYVEFNLVYDRGTLFGLQSSGRTESILMSLPPEVRFVYDWKPEPLSQEAELYTTYLPARDWLAS